MNVRASRVLLAVCILAPSLAACGSDVTLGGPNTLVRVDSEPAGINCEQGGIAVKTGLDTDGDTYLDEDEVTSVQYVCNGVSPVQCAGGVVHEGTTVVTNASEMSDLDTVNCVDGDLLIAGADVDTIALPNLEIVTGDVVIAGNPNLVSLDGLSGLRAVGRRVLVQGNDALLDLGNLGALSRTDAIIVIGNDGLVDLTGLEGLGETNINLTIANNGSLASLHGLENLTTTTKTISIRANRNLTDLSALANMRSVQLLEISGHTSLTAIQLPSLEKVDVRLLIETNSALTDLQIPLLHTVGDFISLDGDAALGSFSAPSLLTVNSVLVKNNTSLTSLSAPQLVFATSNIELVNLPRLTGIDFTGLLSIGNNFLVRNCNQLGTLTGFSALGSVGGTMTFTGNTALPSFGGLGALQLVSGSVTIQNNTALSSFEGLGQFSEIGGDLTITGNSSLLKTTAQSWANSITVHGTVTIN